MAINLISQELLVATASTVIGGIILTLIIFYIKEYIFPLPKLTGCWHVRMHTTKTSYGTYKDMELDYIFIVWLEGNIIRGTCEKTYENSKAQKKRIYR